jgi:predicted nuclease of predicted toxin-antitoxin system
MRLLFDQNLSFRLSERLGDLYPGSSQVRLLGLDRAPDELIWETSKREGYVIVTQDVDFVNLSLLKGPPPLVVWLRCGNQTTAFIEQLLRSHSTALYAFEMRALPGFIEIWP